jgi:hypothetical protein
MTSTTLQKPLACTHCGWPVFPRLPGQKIPATAHGYLDATTSEPVLTGPDAIARASQPPRDINRHDEPADGQPDTGTAK